MKSSSLGTSGPGFESSLCYSLDNLVTYILSISCWCGDLSMGVKNLEQGLMSTMYSILSNFHTLVLSVFQ